MGKLIAVQGCMISSKTLGVTVGNFSIVSQPTNTVTVNGIPIYAGTIEVLATDIKMGDYVCPTANLTIVTQKLYATVDNQFILTEGDGGICTCIGTSPQGRTTAIVFIAEITSAGQTSAILEATEGTGDISGIIKVINNLGEEVVTLKSDLNNTKSDLNNTKSDLKTTQDELGKTNTALENTNRVVNDINVKLAQTDSKVNQMKSVMNKEAYIEWGGRNFEGSYGPIDGCLVPALGANRLAFAKPAGVTVEYSRDSGFSWTDYGASNTSKTMLFTDQGSSFVIGNGSSSTKPTPAWMLRVTLDTGSASVYTQLHKFAIYVSTNGSSGCYCTIEKALQSTPSSFETIANKVPISGWSGYNIINVPLFITYGNSPSSQYGRIRFTFGCTGQGSYNQGLTIYSIQGFGGVGWTTPSTMAKNGRLYQYNDNQDAIFPNAVVAKIVSADSVWGAVAN